MNVIVKYRAVKCGVNVNIKIRPKIGKCELLRCETRFSFLHFCPKVLCRDLDPLPGLLARAELRALFRHAVGKHYEV